MRTLAKSISYRFIHLVGAEWISLTLFPLEFNHLAQSVRFTMPHEKREIVFSMNEFLEALMRYNEMRGGVRYRSHQIRAVGVDRSGSASTDLTFDDEETISFTESDIVASLIAYCIENKVPLPARAGKRVVVTDEGVELAIESKADWVRPVALPITETYRQK